MQAKATLKFTTNFLTGGQIVRDLRRVAFEAGLDIRVERSSEWLERDYAVVVKGDAPTVKAYSAAASNWMQRISRG